MFNSYSSISKPLEGLTQTWSAGKKWEIGGDRKYSWVPWSKLDVISIVKSVRISTGHIPLRARSKAPKVKWLLLMVIINGYY